MRCHIDVQQAPARMFYDHKYRKETKVAVTATQKSQATIAWAWLHKC